MLDYKNFLVKIDSIAESLYNKLGFVDTFIVYFRHGYDLSEMNDDYIIVSWGNGQYVIDNDFNEGQNLYIIDDFISISELRNLLYKKIRDFL